MKKILIVDDEEILRKIYSDRLTFEGFTVETASDGEEALAKIRTSAPNLVLLDILMPKLNGLQVLEQINTDATLKAIPVIVLSNVANDDNIKKALSLGAKDYLLKTNFSPNEIINKIKALIDSNVEKVYRISPRDGYGDVIKISQDFPFMNMYKCPSCGGTLVFELKPTKNPDDHQFVTSLVCDACKKKV
jgi:DNA-binding response OmpR family regulator